MTTQSYAPGTRVKFFPGPRSKDTVVATVIGEPVNGFLVTEDSSGKRRKVRAANIISTV